MERNHLPSPPSAAEATLIYDVQFQLSLLRLMYPGADTLPQVSQLEKLHESGTMARRPVSA